MRRWLRRIALSFWISLYLTVFHTPFVAPLVFYLGLIKAAVVMSFAVGSWSTVFYLLLCYGFESDEIQRRLAQLEKKREQRLLARVRKRLSRYSSGVRSWFSRQLSEKLLPSPFRIFLTFVYPGPLFGVPAVRAAYSSEVNGETLFLIWVGCAASAFLWTFWGWPVVVIIRRLIGILFGGG